MINSHDQKRILHGIMVVVILTLSISTHPIHAISASNTYIEQVIIPQQEFLEEREGNLKIIIDAFQREHIGTYRAKLVPEDSSEPSLYGFWISDLTLPDKPSPPNYFTGFVNILLPAHTSGSYNYHIIISYRPYYLGEYLDDQPGDIDPLDYGTVDIEWKPRLDPLVLQSGNLPDVIRGRLTNDGFLMREVVQSDGSGNEPNIGGIDVEIQVKDGPYEVGVQYPVMISVFSNSSEGEWTNSFGRGIPLNMLAMGSSAISVFFDHMAVEIWNPTVKLDGITLAEEIVHGTIDLISFVTFGAGNLLEQAIHFLVDEFAITAAKLLSSGLISRYFTPTEEVQYINHASHPSIHAEVPKCIYVQFGELLSSELSNITQVRRFNLSFTIEFLKPGLNEVIIVPDLRANVRVIPDNMITVDFDTQFEYRDDLILQFLVDEPDTPPSLSMPGISPGNAIDQITDIYFHVTYTDIDNDPPESIQVFVDGVGEMMSSTDISYTDGAIFTSFPHTYDTGMHSYFFQAIQGNITINTNPLYFSVSKSVDRHNLTLQSMILSHRTAGPGDSIDIDAQINNNGEETENYITANIQVDGPGGYFWPDSGPEIVDIGSLVKGGIWGLARLTTWDIPTDAANGEYIVQVTVSSSSGDKDWSDNTRMKSVYVSDEEPLAAMAYSYRIYQADWTEDPNIDGWPGGAFGPVVLPLYNGKEYIVYMHMSDSNSSTYQMYIEDKKGTEYLNFHDLDFDRYESSYADNDNITFSVALVPYANPPTYALLRLGHPVSGANITPAIQSVPIGSSATYLVHLPCSDCNFDAEVFEGSSGEDPPWIFFDRDRNDWGISRSDQDFTVTASPWNTGVKSFAFATEEWDFTTLNYIVFGKIEGYPPIDNSPEVTIMSPEDGQTVSGIKDIVATAIDDKGVNRVEFYIDGGLVNTDTASPYIYSWDTGVFEDDNHSLMTRAYDDASQFSSHSINIIVDNNQPVITGVSITPLSPTDIDTVTVMSTITDASGLSVVNLLYSSDGGINWNQMMMNNSDGDSWQATIPAHNQGQIQYKVEATDALARTTSTSEISYNVIDASPPVFFGWVESPANLNEDSIGTLRVSVTVFDNGGSGLAGQTPQYDFNFGDGNYDGYENMTNIEGDNWYFDIPTQNWDMLKGQTIFYKASVSDTAGNETTSDDRSELIDSINDAPNISSFLPIAQNPHIDFGECLNLTVTAIDDDNDPLSYEWRVNNSPVATSSDYTFCPEDPELRFHSVVIIVSDGELTEAQSWLVNVIAGPSILHTPIITAVENKSIPISANITSKTSPISVSLHFRVSGSADFTTHPMVNTSDDVYEGTIPGSAVTLAGVDYFVSASSGGFTNTHPITGFYTIQFVVKLQQIYAPLICKSK